MKPHWMKWSVVSLGVLLAGTAAMAQTNDPTIHERKENQQERIGNGVESGQLTAGEAAKLEKKEAAINRETARDRAANGGTLTPAEKAKITRQQDHLSRDIYQQKHDAQTAHYGSNEVDQRRQNQQERIGQGIKSGQLTPGEAARAESQEARINHQVRTERAANGGHLTAGERARVNREQNRASKNIYRKKHNARVKP